MRSIAVSGKRALIFMLLLGILTPACRQEGQKDASASSVDPLVGVLAFNTKDIYTSLVLESLEKQLSGKVVFEVYDAGQDQLRQNGQLEALLRKRPGAIAISVVDSTSVDSVLDRVMESGVPVVFFNREADLSILRAYPKARFVGTEERGAGRMQGQAIAALWQEHPEYDRNGDGKLQFVMFQAAPNIGESLARTEESVKEARSLGTPLEQLGPTYLCNWEYGLALRSMASALESYGEGIELVIANNDAMALGAIEAMNQNGYNLAGGPPDRFIPVVGVDAIPQAGEAIKKGMMSSTVRQDVESMAEAIADMLINSAAGKDFLDGSRFTYDESGIAVRLPYLPFSK